ncbi:MAG: hypothetical protein ACRDJP_16260 [Actinomycetota bacterium]
MRLVLGLLLLAAGAVGGVVAERMLVEPASSADPAAIPENEPRPGDPPLVWLDGELRSLGDTELVLQDGDAEPIEVQRFAGTATRFYAIARGEWQELTETTGVEPGGDVCVEALLDGEAFLAVRVFLGHGCGPL